MSESERLREFAELSFEISRLMTDPRDAEVARLTGEQYLADAQKLKAPAQDSAPHRRAGKRAK